MIWPQKEGDLYIGEDGKVFIRGKIWYSKRRPSVALGFAVHETPMILIQEDVT